jgi:hypothetical protein
MGGTPLMTTLAAASSGILAAIFVPHCAAIAVIV